MPRNSFAEQSKKLKVAVEIAREIVLHSSNLPEQYKQALLGSANYTASYLDSPGKEFRSLRSMAYVEEAFFTFWNETAGPDIEHFWEQVKKAGIGYERKDILRNVLTRTRIRDIHELEHVVDSLVIAQQEGRISAEEAGTLNQYILDFEKRKSRKKPGS